MSTICPHHRPGALSAFLDLIIVRPAAALARSRERAAQRHVEEMLRHMPPERLDDIGLLYDSDGCRTDYGLAQAAERMRTGWS